MPDDPAPDDQSVIARLLRLERRVTELEDRAHFVPRLALPAPKEQANGSATEG